MLPEVPSHPRRQILDEEAVGDTHIQKNKLDCYPALMHLAYAKPDPLSGNPSITVRDAMELGDP